jgi:hypothetical protein
MAQEAAQPILYYRDKLIDYAKKLKEWGESGSKKPDTTWHDNMVKNANESFRKQAEKEAAKKKVVKKPDTTWHDSMVANAQKKYREQAASETAGKKVVKKARQDEIYRKKPTSGKTLPKKRVAGKR